MIYFFIIFSFIFSFGIQSFSIPHNALQLSNANSGIANSHNIHINASGINNLENSISFSSLAWYQGVKGNNIDYKWGDKHHHYISIFNLQASDIEFRDLIPDDNPIGLFDIHHIALSYAFGSSITDNIKIGVKVNFNHNQLYTDESYGCHINFGMSYLYNQFFSFGLTAQQIGSDQYDNASSNYPILLGAGASFNINKLSTQFNTDIIFQDELDSHISLKINSVSRFNSFSLISGYHLNENKKEFSCGFSFKYRKLQFEYGMGFHESLGTPTTFSFKYHI